MARVQYLRLDSHRGNRECHRQQNESQEERFGAHHAILLYIGY
jgi:hypothetical protein